jgi:hypothetical protein
MHCNPKFLKRKFWKPPPLLALSGGIFQIPYMCIGAPRVFCCPRTGIRDISKLN